MAKTGTNIKNYDNSPDMGNVDYVVEWQKPTERNGYTWYRLYASGWIIQGGYLVGGSSNVYTVTLPKIMKDSNYTVISTLRSNTISGGGGSWSNSNALSSSQIQIVEDYKDTWVGQGSYWVVYGYAM